MTTNVQSVVTSSPKANGKVKAQAKGTTAIAALTPEQAYDIAFEAGQSIAGQDGLLTMAFTKFKDNEEVLDGIVQCMTEGYFVRRMQVDRDEAKRIIGLSKYNDRNPDKNTDKNRTPAQEAVMVSVRMAISRAKKLAGITKATDPVEQEKRKAERDAEQARLVTADEIVNPPEDVDVFDALNRLVLTMKGLQKKHALKLIGDRGSEWRDWLANAPR